MQNAAPPERQSNADFFTQPAMQMQWLMFIYSPVVNVQISALSLSSIKLVFLLNHWSSPWTPGYYWRELIPRRVSSMFFLPPDLHSLWPHCLVRAKVPALCCRHACGACSTCHTQTAASQHITLRFIDERGLGSYSLV